MALVTRVGNRSGFTIVELMMVMSIIGILASIGTAQLIDLTKEARATALRDNLRNIRAGISNQLHQYKLRCGGNSPSTSPDLVPLSLVTHFMLNDITALQGSGVNQICTSDNIASEVERKFTHPAAVAHTIDFGGVDLGPEGNQVPVNPMLDTHLTDVVDQIYTVGPGPAALTPDEVCDLVDAQFAIGYQAHWIWDLYDGSIHAGTNTAEIRECAL